MGDVCVSDVGLSALAHLSALLWFTVTLRLWSSIDVINLSRYTLKLNTKRWFSSCISPCFCVPPYRHSCPHFLFLSRPERRTWGSDPSTSWTFMIPHSSRPTAEGLIPADPERSPLPRVLSNSWPSRMLHLCEHSPSVSSWPRTRAELIMWSSSSIKGPK